MGKRGRSGHVGQHSSTTTTESSDSTSPGPAKRPKRSATAQSSGSSSSTEKDYKDKCKKEDVKGKGKGKEKCHNNADIALACPFHKFNPKLFPDCVRWNNPKISTVVRHHVLGTHSKGNKEFSRDDQRRISSKVFSRLLKWKNETRLQQKKAVPIWKEVYAILFEIDNGRQHEIPHPAYEEEEGQALQGIEDAVRRGVLRDPTYQGRMSDRLVHFYETRDQWTISKRRITDEFNQKIRALKDQRDEKLREIDDAYEEAFKALKQGLAEDVQSGQMESSNTVDVRYMLGGNSPRLQTSYDELEMDPMGFGEVGEGSTDINNGSLWYDEEYDGAADLGS